MGNNLPDENMTVLPSDQRLVRTAQLSPHLRWLRTKDGLVLQQAYVCLEDGSLEWFTVPTAVKT
jgi:hypothetical protein